MELEIVSPQGKLYQGNVDYVSLPGALGSFEILPLHAPLISSLQAGTIRYGDSKNVLEKQIIGGFVKVKDDNITICIEQ